MIPRRIFSKMAAGQKAWKEAASVIIIAPRKDAGGSNHLDHSAATNSYPPQVLMLERSKGSRFMASAFVFPGGKLHHSDFSSEWFDVFTHGTGSGWNYLDRTNSDTSNFSVPPILESNSMPDDSNIRRDIAFKLCAIRETFEESGILLARNASSVSKKCTSHSPVVGSVFEPDEPSLLENWRVRLNKDAGEFPRMCKALDAVPDIWSLYGWSNWLTPTAENKRDKYPARFDTLFYVAVLDTMPEASQDEWETVFTQWDHPEGFIARHKKNQCLLYPPQVYELGRLMNFHSVGELHKFTYEREQYGIKRWMPVIQITNDGILSVYPGDDLYPENPDFIGDAGPNFVYHPHSLADMHAKSKNRNRFFRSNLDTKRWDVSCNVDQRPQHISPTNYLSVDVNKPKL